ncbi:MAG: hypothetical protein AAGK05_03680, partial [Pseudomonadota bacterium]
HNEFMGIVSRHLAKELFRPHWNGIKSLLLCKLTLYLCRRLITPTTHPVLLIPALMLGAFSTIVIRAESMRYAVRIVRMYQLYFTLEEL